MCCNTDGPDIDASLAFSSDFIYAFIQCWEKSRPEYGYNEWCFHNTGEKKLCSITCVKKSTVNKSFIKCSFFEICSHIYKPLTIQNACFIWKINCVCKCWGKRCDSKWRICITQVMDDTFILSSQCDATLSYQKNILYSHV